MNKFPSMRFLALTQLALAVCSLAVAIWLGYMVFVALPRYDSHIDQVIQRSQTESAAMDARYCMTERKINPDYYATDSFCQPAKAEQPVQK